LLYLIFLELILKLLEDGFKEACGADGVYMVLKKKERKKERKKKKTNLQRRVCGHVL